MAPADPLPPWRTQLSGARRREGRSPLARWLQLGTVAADGTPRVRTLVFRGWAGASVLDLLTDARSAKATELALQPAVELCWLLPRARCQFRMRGSLLALPAAQLAVERQRHWDQLTPAGRALWGWPPPGSPLQVDGDFPEELPADLPVPQAFQLLRIALNQVEMLALGALPHRRLRWRAGAAWAEEPLNP